MSDHLFAEISKLDWQCHLWQTTHCIIVTRIELDLRIIIMNLNTKSHLSKSKPCQEKERKLQIIGIFRRPQNRIWPRICIPNFISVCTTTANKMNGNLVDRPEAEKRFSLPSSKREGGGGHNNICFICCDSLYYFKPVNYSIVLDIYDDVNPEHFSIVLNYF